MSLEQAAGDGGSPPGLPPNGVLSGWAQRELLKLRPRPAQAALFEAFGRRCEGRHLVREDEYLPIGKGRSLRSIRTTFSGSEYRLIYAQVRPIGSRGSRAPTAVAVRIEARPLRFVALLAWAKKRANVGDRGNTAWERSERWLEAHPGYERA